MATILGRDGTMKVATNAVAEITNFRIREQAGDISVNSMGSGDWDLSRSGRKSWTADVDAMYDPSDTDGQMAFLVGAELAVEFFPEGDTSGKQRRSGTARVSSIEVSGEGADDSVFTFSCSLTGVGALSGPTDVVA